MHRTLFKKISLCALGASLLIGATTATHAAQADSLRTPDRVIQHIEDSGKAAYDHSLAEYRQAMRAHPADAGLVLAACQFSEHFAGYEDLPWAALAGQDYDACRVTLENMHSSDPDIALYLLEHRYGKPAVEFGEPLVARSHGWSAAQQARLHAALARAYQSIKDTERAGREAVLTVQLDPSSVQLDNAIRYLAKHGQAAEAARLLAAAPLPKYAWLEAARIRAATETLPGNAAKDEWLRAQRAGLTIDPFVAARALEHVGDAAGAHAILKAAKSEHRVESPQDRQFRLDLAFDVHDTQAAADILGEQSFPPANVTQSASAFLRLVSLDPSIVGRPDIRRFEIYLPAYLLPFLLAIVAAPGVLMFPAHYRGTVRRRLGKPLVPLFGRIGLRHAWLALAIFLPTISFLSALQFGGNRLLSSSGGGVARLDWQQGATVSYLWALLITALALAPLAWRLSWREWLGSGRWKPVWLLLPGALLAYDAYLTHHWLAHPHTTYDWSNSPWVVAIVQGARALGGVPLALLITSLLTPIVEEFVFRGCLLGGLTRHLSFGWANFLQAALFAAVHHEPRYFVYLCLLGMVAGWLTRKTRGLAMPILLHGANNLIFVLWVAT